MLARFVIFVARGHREPHERWRLRATALLRLAQPLVDVRVTHARRARPRRVDERGAVDTLVGDAAGRLSDDVYWRPARGRIGGRYRLRLPNHLVRARARWRWRA